MHLHFCLSVHVCVCVRERERERERERKGREVCVWSQFSSRKQTDHTEEVCMLSALRSETLRPGTHRTHNREKDVRVDYVHVQKWPVIITNNHWIDHIWWIHCDVVSFTLRCLPQWVKPLLQLTWQIPCVIVLSISSVLSVNHDVWVCTQKQYTKLVCPECSLERRRRKKIP